jgi:peptidoglycan/LPS O-acetylase OafA/YrhL
MSSTAIQSIHPFDRLQMNLRRRQIPGLDGIRGIAALSVVGFHDQEINHHDWFGHIYPGRFAVQIFFVISGLLITWLLLSEEKRDGSVNRRRFYWRRSFRLLPALVALLAWQQVTHIPSATRSNTIATALYYANYYLIFHWGPKFQGGLVHTWSLAVEEHFYLIWPQVFFFVRNWRTLLKVCLVVAALQIAWRLIDGFHGHVIYAELSTETVSYAALAGCMLAILLWHAPHRIPRFVFFRGLTPISLVVVLGLGLLPKDAQGIWGIPLGLPFMAILVLQAITYEWRLLENPVARYFGRISYSVYLWGLVAIEVASRIEHDRYRLSAFAIAIAIGSASHFIIERPFQSLGLKLESRLKRQISLPLAHETRSVSNSSIPAETAPETVQQVS